MLSSEKLSLAFEIKIRASDGETLFVNESVGGSGVINICHA
jgi:hypothetical protein